MNSLEYISGGESSMYRCTIKNWNRRSCHTRGVLILLATLLICGQALSVPQPLGSEIGVTVIVTRLDQIYPEAGSHTSMLIQWLEATYVEHPSVQVRFLDTSSPSGIDSIKDFLQGFPVGSFVVISGSSAIAGSVLQNLSCEIIINGDQQAREAPFPIGEVQLSFDQSTAGSSGVPDMIYFLGRAVLASIYYQRGEFTWAGIECTLALAGTEGVPGILLSEITSLREDLLDITRDRRDLFVLSDSIELEPDRGVLFLERALVNVRLRRFAESMEDFDTAMALGPSGPGEYATYSEGILDLLYYTRCAYNERIAFEPGMFHSVEASLDEAVAYLDSAIELDSDNPELYFTRAGAHGYLINWHWACDDLSVAILLDPGYFQAYNSRGNINAEMGYPDEGLLDLTRAIELAPDSISYYEDRANAYRMLGDEEKAQADLETASRLIMGN